MRTTQQPPLLHLLPSQRKNAWLSRLPRPCCCGGNVLGSARLSSTFSSFLCFLHSLLWSCLVGSFPVFPSGLSPFRTRLRATLSLCIVFGLSSSLGTSLHLPLDSRYVFSRKQLLRLSKGKSSHKHVRRREPPFCSPPLFLLQGTFSLEHLFQTRKRRKRHRLCLFFFPLFFFFFQDAVEILGGRQRRL